METDYWSDGDASHWTRNWKKTGEDTHLYTVSPSSPFRTVSCTQGTTQYNSTAHFIGKWIQKDEEKSLVYFEYIFNKDGTGTQIHKADMSGETQSVNVPLVWKSLREKISGSH